MQPHACPIPPPHPATPSGYSSSDRPPAPAPPISYNDNLAFPIRRPQPSPPTPPPESIPPFLPHPPPTGTDEPAPPAISPSPSSPNKLPPHRPPRDRPPRRQSPPFLRILFVLTSSNRKKMKCVYIRLKLRTIGNDSFRRSDIIICNTEELLPDQYLGSIGLQT